MLLNAVDGDTIIYTDHSQQAYIWRPTHGGPKPVDLALPKMSFVSGVDGAAEDTELTGYAGEIVQMSWDPSGSLVVGTVSKVDARMLNPNDEITFYQCDPATGDCVLILGSTTTVAAAPEPANLQNAMLLSTTAP